MVILALLVFALHQDGVVHHFDIELTGLKLGHVHAHLEAILAHLCGGWPVDVVLVGHLATKGQHLAGGRRGADGRGAGATVDRAATLAAMGLQVVGIHSQAEFV